jgi:hypothetical protein
VYKLKRIAICVSTLDLLIVLVFHSAQTTKKLFHLNLDSWSKLGTIRFDEIDCNGWSLPTQCQVDPDGENNTDNESEF